MNDMGTLYLESSAAQQPAGNDLIRGGDGRPAGHSFSGEIRPGRGRPAMERDGRSFCGGWISVMVSSAQLS
jgi:hypothetical protein